VINFLSTVARWDPQNIKMRYSMHKVIGIVLIAAALGADRTCQLDGCAFSFGFQGRDGGC